ncbi:TIGR02444 family protein [Psychrosphaera sp. B3R10]|uniref:TIGR02444 family protein n=1 Tax=unclassified Psychrosphaera TaxID=2641570 RepID=UPI001C08DAE2|nr:MULTISPECIES: TIGR02444 family protein [unclassified Psychrosphaera]MBU2883702.1 TIGR02444 family protein [Psychrosphaera sp. I2R16]MBU2987996.1 TIGR02444 family protein [Psychrosphaera sp. B3R10]
MIAQDQFWQFSLAHYQQPNVQATMLSWQDNYGANVNLALLCIYLTENSLSLSRDNIAALHNKVIEFDRSYTRPLRELRKMYKANQSALSHYKTIRQALLSAELELEKQQQAILIDTCNTLKLQTKTDDNWLNYQNYLKQL